jgi:tRNA (guanine37-N1)-methyltransferase
MLLMGAKALRIDILTLFPGIFDSPFRAGITGRALNQELVTINTHNIRDYSHDKHHSVDDYTYGGGAGMVLKPEPVFEAVESIISDVNETDNPRERPIILLTPQGRLFSQAIARELSGYRQLILVCGQYEGVDERIRQYLATDEISIGDYVLSCGELAAMVVVNAIIRLLPGVLGSPSSANDDSHSNGLLEYPQYTRPVEYRGYVVPDVLLSGDHARIACWRRQQAVIRTLKRRPDLIERANLNAEEKEMVKLE